MRDRRGVPLFLPPFEWSVGVCFIFLRTVLLSSGCVIEGQHQTKLEDSQSGRWEQKEALGVKEG